MDCLTNDASIGRHARALAAVAVLVLAPLSGQARAQSRGSAHGGPPAPAPAPEPPGPVNVIHRNGPAAGERLRRGRRPYPLTSSTIAAYGYLPVVITADGRVFADLGYGFVPIERACGYATGIATPQGYAAPTYTPPAMITPTPLNPEDPANRRAAEQAAASARAAAQSGPDSASHSQAPVSCWARDAAGYVYIGRQ